MELKYQNQALKDGQHGQILNETSNKAKIKKEIEVLETINIELEHSVAKLLAENEKLHKENEHLKQTYKDLYDSIKKTRVQTKDLNDSLIAQVNSKTVENADLKAQIQEKVFANVALKNELRKLKGNSVDTKFAKPSILGKPVLQPPRNQSVVRQPNAFKSERPNFSKPRFASQVDVNNDLPKPVTPHYLPKVREFVLAKPHHVITPGSSRNSLKESYGSNDMAHNYYLEEAKKKTQEKNRNLKPRKMPFARTHHSPNTCTPKPRSNNQTSRNWHAYKSSEETLKAVQKADHSRNPSSFSNSKHFVQSPKTRNSNKPVEPKIHTQKPGKQIFTGHRFSPNKSSAVPTGKIFTSSTTKVDCETSNGSNENITNPYKFDQTINVRVGLVQNSVSPTTYVPPSKRDYEILFQPLFDEYFNPPPCAVSPDPVAVAAPRPVDPAGSPLSTTIDQDVPSASTSPTNQEIQFQVTHQGVEEQIHGHQNAQFDNAPLLHNLPSDPSSEETTLQGVIPSNLHHLNQSFDTLTKLTKNHPLENVIGDPSRPVLD
ncbi:hypothetical protein Tco_0531359 [Tanacetum coccineum]